MKTFKRLLVVGAIVFTLHHCTFAAVTIDTVLVGDVGNPSDLATGLGSVSYGYSIGKYEVTLNQYTAFLNAVGATESYGLYNTSMGVPTPANPTSGIDRSGVSGSYAYSVIGSGTRPVTYVSWFDAARFVNWLGNGQPTGVQAAGTTETGAYTLNGQTTGGGPLRNGSWTYGLPSESEWYKAAYYQPANQGGDVDGYWLYPTGSNTQPNSRNGSLTDPNSGNFNYDDGIANGYNGGFAVNNATTTPISALTDVGAFALANSFYGTFDQGGDVREWNDKSGGTGTRSWRGGGWFDSTASLSATSGSSSFSGNTEQNQVGFRIVMVPEPSIAGLCLIGVAAVYCRRKPR